MTVLRCLQCSDSTGSSGLAYWWIGLFCFLSLYYIGLFVYGLIPFTRLRAEFRPNSLFGQATRVAPVIALSAKILFGLGALFVGHYFDDPTPETRLLNTWGLGLLTFPSYIIASVYTLVVAFWLSICVETSPARYDPLFKKLKWILTTYNIVFYVLFMLSVIVQISPALGKSAFRFYLSSSAGIGRDFILCLVFVVLDIHLRPNPSEEAYLAESMHEKRLFWFTITLSIFLLVRGTFSLVQALAFQDRSDLECGPAVLVWYLLNEIVIEGFPMAYCLYGNNSFMIGQYSAGLDVRSLASMSSRR
jgi:hypothetical protein